MNNITLAFFGAIAILCLAFAFYLDTKSLELQKELLKSIVEKTSENQNKF